MDGLHSLSFPLVAGALDNAFATCAARSPNDGMIHHSDRGIQYTSNRYREILEQREIVCRIRAAFWQQLGEGG
ncbi:MAG: hypothetical protein QGH76_09420 [Phycisphaerales bacterium]|nr:hypothetical protein [Phycisphaerales bacterium]